MKTEDIVKQLIAKNYDLDIATLTAETKVKLQETWLNWIFLRCGLHEHFGNGDAFFEEFLEKEEATVGELTEFVLRTAKER